MPRVWVVDPDCNCYEEECATDVDVEKIVGGHPHHPALDCDNIVLESGTLAVYLVYSSLGEHLPCELNWTATRILADLELFDFDDPAPGPETTLAQCPRNHFVLVLANRQSGEPVLVDYPRERLEHDWPRLFRATPVYRLFVTDLLRDADSVARLARCFYSEEVLLAKYFGITAASSPIFASHRIAVVRLFHSAWLYLISGDKWRRLPQPRLYLKK